MFKWSQLSCLIALFLIGFLVAPGSAAVIDGITWLEVDSSNASVASGSIETDGFDGGGGDQTDNNWDYTTPFGVIGPGNSDERNATGNGTGVLMRNNTEDAGNLTFSVPGILDPGTNYTVYVAFRGASQFEGVEVSLDNSDWDQHTRNGADTDLDGSFDSVATTILGFDTNNSNYYYVDGGIGTLSGTTDLNVFFREPTTDVPGTSADWQWTIIDAIGLDPAPLTIPEPTGMAIWSLIGAAVAAWALIFRRK